MLDPPVRRRSRQQVRAEREAYAQAIHNQFKAAMEGLGWPDYVQTNLLLLEMYRGSMAISVSAFRHHTQRVMAELGWDRIPNPSSRDKRWHRNCESFHVYGRRGMTNVNGEFLKKELDW